MGYEERMLLVRLEQKVDLLLEEIRPEVFEEEQPTTKKKTLAQLKAEVEATDEEEMDDEEEVEEEPKPKKRKLFGRK